MFGQTNPTKFSTASIPNLAGKVYLVTGGNTGIGYETCLELSRKNAQVFMASRSEDRANAAIARIKAAVPDANIEFIKLQLGDLKQVRSAAQAFVARGIKLDCLVNNAGIMASPFALSVDGIEEQFATNHVGHFLLTRELMPALLKAPEPRVVNLSSSYHDKAPRPEGIRFADINNPKGMSVWDRYGQSKLANILFTRGLNSRFGDKIYANSVHPGFVDTELTRGPVASNGAWLAPILGIVKFFGALTPQDGALTSLYVATSPDIVSKGLKDRFFVPIAWDSPESLTDLGKSHDLVDKLWTFTEDLIKEKIGA